MGQQHEWKCRTIAFTCGAGRKEHDFSKDRDDGPVKCNGWLGAFRNSRPQLRHRGQRVGIAGQEPAAVGLFTVNRDTMTGELHRFSADARGHR